MPASVPTDRVIALASATIDIWHGEASWWALLITALVAAIADAVVFYKYFWRPLRQCRELARRGREAGITMPAPALSVLFSAKPLIWTREAPSGTVRLDSMLDRLHQIQGIASVSQTDREIVLRGIQPENQRMFVAEPTNFDQARITFGAADKSCVKLVGQVKFGRANATRLGLVSTGVLAVIWLVVGWAFPNLRGYMRMMLVFIMGYAIGLLIACWLGQRLLTLNFFDALIIESSSRP
jgi:hypothetical protein